jgi:hypothetical protein
MAVRKEDIFTQLFIKLLPVTFSLKVFSSFNSISINYREIIRLVRVCICQLWTYRCFFPCVYLSKVTVSVYFLCVFIYYLSIFWSSLSIRNSAVYFLCVFVNIDRFHFLCVFVNRPLPLISCAYLPTLNASAYFLYVFVNIERFRLFPVRICQYWTLPLEFQFLLCQCSFRISEKAFSQSWLEVSSHFMLHFYHYFLLLLSKWAKQWPYEFLKWDNIVMNYVWW